MLKNCHRCLFNKKIEELQKIATSRGGYCLSNIYFNNHTKLLWECNKGHKWKNTSHHILSGQWCPFCAHNKIGTIEKMQLIAKNRGGECLSKIYINEVTNLNGNVKEDIHGSLNPAY